MQLHGYKGTHEAQLDPIRSEYPQGVGSGFVAAASAASANLLLSVPSGKVVQIKYIYAYAGTVGTLMFYDGGSVGSLNTTVYEVYLASAQSAPGGNEFRPMGLYVQSLLFASMGAASTPAIKVAGYIYDTSAAV